MKTMDTPSAKLTLSEWWNSIQDRMAVKMVPRTLLYFFRMVSANCNAGMDHDGWA